MERTAPRYVWLNTLAVLLVFPAAYFIFISFLKYGLSINGFFDASQPLLERLGIKESLGFNINLLILLGPVLALLIGALQVLAINWQFTREQFQFRLVILRRWVPISIALFSGLVLAFLGLYLAGENLAWKG